jgi:hypothetical protein
METFNLLLLLLSLNLIGVLCQPDLSAVSKTVDNSGLISGSGLSLLGDCINLLQLGIHGCQSSSVNVANIDLEKCIGLLSKGRNCGSGKEIPPTPPPKLPPSPVDSCIGICCGVAFDSDPEPFSRNNKLTQAGTGVNGWGSDCDINLYNRMAHDLQPSFVLGDQTTCCLKADNCDQLLKCFFKSCNDNKPGNPRTLTCNCSYNLMLSMCKLRNKDRSSQNSLPSGQYV